MATAKDAIMQSENPLIHSYPIEGKQPSQGKVVQLGIIMRSA
jgi:hypothetical protein